MPAAPVDTRQIGFRLSGRSVTFRPVGPRRRVGRGVRTYNPVKDTYTNTQAARLFVGFLERDGRTLVMGSASRAMKALISLVKATRARQAGIPDATFVAQHGVYTHRATRQTVTEPGAQIILVDVTGAKPEDWAAQMIELAEIIARKFKQESVYVDLQVNGVTQRVLDVGA